MIWSHVLILILYVHEFFYSPTSAESLSCKLYVSFFLADSTVDMVSITVRGSYRAQRTTPKLDDRAGTPSTTCGGDLENVDLWQNGQTQSSRPELAQSVLERMPSPTIRRRSKGLTNEQFAVAVRQPFSFPTAPNIGNGTNQQLSGSTPIPVCIICQHRLSGGDMCRELSACGHCFHSDCAEEYFQYHSRCPVCKTRCKPSSVSKRNRSHLTSKHRTRPFWTPDYDAELLSISDRVDRERRARSFLMKGIRDDTPSSQIFLKSSLPVLLEECCDDMTRDDGSLLSLCKFLHKEKERRVLASIKNWNQDMQKVATSFVLSSINMYLYQKKFVELYIKMCTHCF
jgi:hypothetical protein